MNGLYLCIEVVQGHVNHCVAFAIEYLETVKDRGFQQKMAYGESNGHVTDDGT